MSTIYVPSTVLGSDTTPSRAMAAADQVAPRTSLFEWLLVITGGLIVGLPFVFWLGESGLSRSDTVRWYFWISTLISSPHVYSTYVRLQRKVAEDKVSVWLGWPAYFGIVVLLAIVSHWGWFLEIMTAINVWQSFHYVRQTYGVGCMYGRQREFTERDRTWRWLSYHLTFPWLIVGRWDTLHEVWGGRTYSLIPLDFGLTAMMLLGALALLGVLSAFVHEVRLAWRSPATYSPLGLVCFLICLGVHAYGFVVPSHYNRGFFAVTIFHAVQYLALVWFLERRHSVQHQGWLAYLPNAAGFVLFWLILFGLGFGYEQHLTVAISRYWTTASTILLAAISAHHYVLDTFLWRRHVGA